MIYNRLKSLKAIILSHNETFDSYTFQILSVIKPSTSSCSPLCSRCCGLSSRYCCTVLRYVSIKFGRHASRAPVRFALPIISNKLCRFFDVIVDRNIKISHSLYGRHGRVRTCTHLINTVIRSRTLPIRPLRQFAPLVAPKV